MIRLRRLGLPIRLQRLCAALSVFALNAVAHAQGSVAAPQPNLSKSPPAWLGLLVIFIMLVMVITVSLMPSRRGHQD